VKRITRVVNKRAEPFDVYIGRPSKWGNPFEIGRDGDRAEVIEKHRVWFMAQPDMIREAKAELKGKRLGCFCAPLPCHGDIYAKVADQIGLSLKDKS
jgi:hypothetical protein